MKKQLCMLLWISIFLFAQDESILVVRTSGDEQIFRLQRDSLELHAATVVRQIQTVPESLDHESATLADSSILITSPGQDTLSVTELLSPKLVFIDRYKTVAEPYRDGSHIVDLSRGSN